jgi:hypothetical protein
MTVAHRRLLMAACFLSLSVAPLSAQRLSVGIEGGGASVDDRRGLQPAFGISLLWPMGQSFAGALSYQQWFPGGPAPAPSAAGNIGERALTLTALLRAAQTERILWLIGGGFGQYERVIRTATDTDHAFDGALTASTLLMIRLTERLAWYLKFDIATPTGEWDARWGSIHFGLAIPVL